MDLESFKNTRTIRKAASVSFYKTGYVCFNKVAVDVLNIKEGDRVTFHQDKQNKGDWYISFKESPDSLLLSQEQGRLKLNSAQLCDRMHKSIAYEGPSFACVISTESFILNGRKFYPLITSSAK